MQKLLIFPFGGNSIEALEACEGQFEVIGFIDDDKKKHGLTYGGILVRGREAFNEFPEAKVLAVPGSPDSYKKRAKLIQNLNLNDDRFVNVVAKSAYLGSQVVIGFNNLILANTVVTSNAKLGNHNVILCNSSIHHDCEIGDYNLIGSKVVIAGNVLLGDNNYLGSGSNLKNNITIGSGNLIGMGSNLLTSIESNKLVYGNPAKTKD